jgi:phosphatidylinositol kinase/protein kinase (PI-3  family)
MKGFVGHVIGLGDRHGSNILVDQLTWGALHIDFGDVRLFLLISSFKTCRKAKKRRRETEKEM